MHIGTQHEHTSGVVFTHQYVYIESIAPMASHLVIGQDEEAECSAQLHEAYRSVLGAVAWTVPSRVDLTAYVQALQRRAHAPRIQRCKKLSLIIR